MMKVESAGYVLHARPYRETSLLVDCFSESEGRISVVAKGVRQLKSRRTGLLQPFIPLLLSWVGKTDLYTLCQVESGGALRLLSGHELLCGLYINELLMRALHRHDPHPDVYQAYQLLLVSLSDCPEKALRIFEKKLLWSLGYGFSFDNIDPDGNYMFDISQGGLVQVNNNPCFNSPYSFLGKHILALESESADLNNIDYLKSIKKLMRMALAPLLNNKPLRTRELFV